MEKTRSDGAEVAGIERYFRASLAKYGKLVSLTLHQSSIFSFLYKMQDITNCDTEHTAIRLRILWYEVRRSPLRLVHPYVHRTQQRIEYWGPSGPVSRIPYRGHTQIQYSSERTVPIWKKPRPSKLTPPWEYSTTKNVLELLRGVEFTVTRICPDMYFQATVSSLFE